MKVKKSHKNKNTVNRKSEDTATKSNTEFKQKKEFVKNRKVLEKYRNH